MSIVFGTRSSSSIEQQAFKPRHRSIAGDLGQAFHGSNRDNFSVTTLAWTKGD
jgi:hypothetical protein